MKSGSVFLHSFLLMISFFNHSQSKLMKGNQQRPQVGRNSAAAALKNVFNVKVLSKDAQEGFKLLNGVNREVMPAHVTKMCQSINKFGIIRPVVVADLSFDGFLGTYILDGTHLYHACLRSNLDIPYKEVIINNPQELVECLAMLNNSSKSWKLTDYVQAWAYLHHDYKRLMSYHNVYDLELTSIAGILSDSVNIFSSINTIKDGSFRIKDEDQAVMILDMVSDLVNLFPKYERVQYKNLVNGFVHFVKSNLPIYDHDFFMDLVKLEISSLHTAATTSHSAAEFFHNLYNH